MISADSIELISTDEDLFSTNVSLVSEDDGTVVRIPVERMSRIGAWGMTIGLAAIATPFCYSLASMMDFEHLAVDLAVPIPWLWKCVPLIAWLIAVFGPIGVYCFLPFGDHWISYDRRTQLFSVRRGSYRWHRNQINYLLSVSGAKNHRRRITTELQICVTETNQCKKYLLLHTTHTDPEKAFGRTLRDFASAIEVPAYIANVSVGGSHKDMQRIDIRAGRPYALPCSNLLHTCHFLFVSGE